MKKPFLKRDVPWAAKVCPLLAAVLICTLVKAAPAHKILSAKAVKSLPQSQNAYYYYLKAGVSLPKDAPKSTFPEFDEGSSAPDKIAPFHSALERNEAVLKAYARTLELLRQGFVFKYKKPPSSDSMINNMMRDMHFNSHMRQIARVLRLESQVKAEKGDWAGAANSAVDGIRLAQDISHGSIIDVLVARAIEGIVSKNLSNAFTNVNAETAQVVAKRLEKILANKVQYADILTAEKQEGLLEYELLADTPDWRKQYPTTKSLAELKKVYVKAMDSLITNAGLPYSQRKMSIKIPADPVNKEILGFYGDSESGMVQGSRPTIQQTINTLIMVAFALRAYQLQHGYYPESLQALVPEYLHQVPDDPFALHSPLIYKRNKKTYTLYSIGPDGKNDGGKPINGKRIFADSKGDILAGTYNW